MFGINLGTDKALNTSDGDSELETVRAMQSDRKWFHLSATPIEQPAITDVRMPDFDFLDVNEPCFSVAPTVWQCVLAISKEGQWYIHEVDVLSPESAEKTTGDGSFTHEHRITQRVLDSQDGSIPIRCIGEVEIGKDLLIQLKILFLAKRLKCDAAQEVNVLWTVDGSRWRWRGLSVDLLERTLRATSE